MGKRINVLEVGPRDGWQNLKQMLTFEQKVELIDAMLDAGVKEMEVTSFVSPKAIPQMADAAELAKTCIEKHPQHSVLRACTQLQRCGERGERGQQERLLCNIREREP